MTATLSLQATLCAVLMKVTWGAIFCCQSCWNGERDVAVLYTNQTFHDSKLKVLREKKSSFLLFCEFIKGKEKLQKVNVLYQESRHFGRKSCMGVWSIEIFIRRISTKKFLSEFTRVNHSERYVSYETLWATPLGLNLFWLIHGLLLGWVNKVQRFRPNEVHDSSGTGRQKFDPACGFLLHLL